MTQICEKCEREYVTGADDIESKDNQYSTTKVTMYLERTVGYNTTMIEERNISDDDLCPKCAEELWELLTDVYYKYRYGRNE